jgi:glycerol-3-phosphate responsive antiterminator
VLLAAPETVQKRSKAQLAARQKGGKALSRLFSIDFFGLHSINKKTRFFR